ncbi:MAG: CBS domain-containing protein [Pseudomonadota bacterium]|nr:MAG: CBS domain-containing protein [Pseudomonadota bacterium]
MTNRITSISPDVSIREAAHQMHTLNIGTLPVMDGDRLAGIVTDRDICCRVVSEGLDPAITRVRDIMSADVTCCFGDQPIEEAAHLMEDKHIRRLAVLNRDNTMAGLLSVDDLARGSHDLAGEVLDVVVTH